MGAWVPQTEFRSAKKDRQQQSENKKATHKVAFTKQT
ncbi:Hypothetical protein Bdt_1037 [Bdellovibrio bacteriovorus str. Tiberius]|uniref:Uncharacterized protein n=1 Tax=Bdellovibrio bacteriovorus str. Tiberius TaxID=1069642 RepID=K7ZEQ7_BDEBC|nr:Hypothetical protein Bdt_1037 [Bdellovibrio bacteriovorus str. Tiberius]